MRALLLGLVTAALVPACAAYDHDLGGTPFLCGQGEPRCPADYRCEEDPSTGDEVCVAAGSQVGMVQCADDSVLEPNETLAKATVASVSFQREGLAICPATDKDTFAITVSGAGKIELAVTFERGAALRATLLNTGGVPLSAAALDEATRTLHATADVPRAGTYYAQVSSASGLSNNYQITLHGN